MSHALHPAHINLLNSQESLPIIARWSVSFAVVVTKWDRNHRTRKHLKNLAPRELDDIGVDRLQAHLEASKPFWQD